MLTQVWKFWPLGMLTKGSRQDNAPKMDHCLYIYKIRGVKLIPKKKKKKIRGVRNGDKDFDYYPPKPTLNNS